MSDEKKKVFLPDNPHIQIAAQGLGARAQRKRVIREVLDEWNKQAPKALKEFINFLHEITKVQHNNGAWEKANVKCEYRIPAPLHATLQNAFRLQLPDELPWAAKNSDFDLLFEVVPALNPGKK